MPIIAQIQDVVDTASQLLCSAAVYPTSFKVILLVGIFVWIIINKEKKLLERLDNYMLEVKNADPEVMGVIKDIREAYYFRIATGIYAEHSLRHALINLHESAHVFSWKLISRAYEYIELASDGKITIRNANWLEKLEYRYNSIVSYLMLFFAVIVLTFFALPSGKTWSSLLSMFATSVFLFLIAVFSQYQTRPLRAAIKIQNELKQAD